ncbi:hypothetical protein [Streptomyces mirabilis]|uniref:hypothetical protein n=1 Tax=Streptomyces mirabilis TaxID=68239 RepID=UPI0036D8B636
MPRVFPPGTCDGGPRGLLDFDAARRPVAAEAARDFHDWYDFAAGHPAAHPLEFFWEKHQGDPACPPRRVHEEYLGQAVLKALHDERPDLRDRIGSYPAGDIGDDLAAYLKVEDTEPVSVESGPASPIGALTVPSWRPGFTAVVLPQGEFFGFCASVGRFNSSAGGCTSPCRRAASSRVVDMPPSVTSGLDQLPAGIGQIARIWTSFTPTASPASNPYASQSR